MDSKMLKQVVRGMFLQRKNFWEVCRQEYLLDEDIVRAAERIVQAISAGGKMLVFGNGGSAAEAQHFAAELVGRFEKDRRALPAIALTTDASIITAQANDSGYATIFSRQIEALAKPGDVVIGMTTSDVHESHSENIREGFRAAQNAGCTTIGFFSKKTVELLELVDVALVVPDDNTARIQEVHLAIIHIISRIVEEELS
jgi:D-sedoheptulose 7-phosphate isomerase